MSNKVQRWTGAMRATDAGGFVAYGDYLYDLRAAVEAEREACAKVCEEDESGRDGGGYFADAIRARGNKEDD